MCVPLKIYEFKVIRFRQDWILTGNCYGDNDEEVDVEELLHALLSYGDKLISTDLEVSQRGSKTIQQCNSGELNQGVQRPVPMQEVLQYTDGLGTKLTCI
jgi:hypothetical protein